jgi:hypothetical protein
VKHETVNYGSDIQHSCLTFTIFVKCKKSLRTFSSSLITASEMTTIVVGLKIHIFTTRETSLPLLNQQRNNASSTRLAQSVPRGRRDKERFGPAGQESNKAFGKGNCPTSYPVSHQGTVKLISNSYTKSPRAYVCTEQVVASQHGSCKNGLCKQVGFASRPGRYNLDGT